MKNKKHISSLDTTGKKKRIIILAISVTLMLITLCVFLICLAAEQISKTRSSLSTSTSQIVRPSQTIEQSDPESADKLLQAALSYAGKPSTNIGTNILSIYRGVDGYEFEAPTSRQSTYTTMIHIPEEEYKATKSKIETYFKTLQYDQLDKGVSSGGRSTGFDGKNYSCRLDEWGLANVQDEGMVRTILFLCASTKTIAQEAEKLRPFYNLIRSNPTVEKDNITMLPFNEVASKTPGYSRFNGALIKQTLSKGSGPVFQAVFYKSAGGSWQVTYRTPGGFMCADITTDDARKAFAGEKCFETDGKTSRTI